MELMELMASPSPLSKELSRQARLTELMELMGVGMISGNGKQLGLSFSQSSWVRSVRGHLAHLAHF